MSDQEKTTAGRDPEPEEDVEGHNIWIGPTVSRDLARNRAKEIERQARDRRRAKEARR